MNVDETLLSNGLTPQIIEKLIYRHKQGDERRRDLYDYYLGKHAILQRERSSDKVSNNRIVCNHAKYIVDMTKSYLIGNPVQYETARGLNISAVVNNYQTQDIACLDGELEKEMSILGNTFELIFADEEANIKSVRLSPLNTFMVYSCGTDEKILYAIHYYRIKNLDGITEKTRVLVFTPKSTDTYECMADNIREIQLLSSVPHRFGCVPLIEYKNNEERQGDFEQLISLIDAYNILISDRINDKEQFVDAFLFLKGVELDSDEAQKLKDERVLMGYDGADAKYLSKTMQESDINVLRNDIKQDIHRFSMVPDLSDESFGNNLSGVAIKYRLMGFEQAIRNKERYFTGGLKQRFAMYNKFLTLKGSMTYIPVSALNIIYTRNMPSNDLEISQIIKNLEGIVPNQELKKFAQKNDKIGI